MTDTLSPEDRLAALGLRLPEVTEPTSNYVDAVLAGGLLFLGGQAPFQHEGHRVSGQVGGEITLDEAVAHARSVALGLLAAARHELGSLDRVRRVVRVFGLVNAVPGFEDHKVVLNGCSDVFTAVFGDAGKHARFSGGAGTLPFNITLEIEAIFAIEA